MNRLLNILPLLALAMLLVQCEPNVSERVPSSGQADFSTFITVGNSLTAGYADNALHRHGQVNSFSAIVAEQLKAAGGGDFIQPLVAEGVGSDATGNARLTLQIVNGNLGPAPAAAQGQQIFGDRIHPVHNLGVPGARSYHLLADNYGNPAAGAGNFNPFFTRFNSEASASVIGDAVALDPTFFTLWIGNNDVLGYATAGGTGVVHEAPVPPQDIAGNDITPVAVFTGSIDNILNALTANGAKGVVLNIPDVTSIPFFTTVPWNGLVLTAEQAGQLRAGYAAQGVPEALIPDFREGANGFIIADENEALGFRMATSEDHILLTVPQANLQNEGWGSTVPIPDQFTLRSDQVAAARSAVTQFNNVLQAAANARNLPYVDMNSVLQQATNPGLLFDAIQMNTVFVQGGIFSLDGVHLTPRGSAVVANIVLDAINQAYGASVSPVNVADFEGVRFP